MDKTLKKFSRTELLELLLSMSEDYERLAAENARLRKAASSRRLPRSMKVGSIAEASLQANGYFEAAQRSANEYLREIKLMHDELSRRMKEQSDSAVNARVEAAARTQKRAEAELRQAELERQQAKEQSQEIIDRANAEAEEIIAQARARADKLFAEANRRARDAEAVQAKRRAAMAEGSMEAVSDASTTAEIFLSMRRPAHAR